MRAAPQWVERAMRPVRVVAALIATAMLLVPPRAIGNGRTSVSKGYGPLWQSGPFMIDVPRLLAQLAILALVCYVADAMMPKRSSD